MTAPRKVALTEEEILEAAENHATRFAPIQRQTTAIAGYTAGAYMVRDFYEQRGAEKDAALVRERECREKLVAALESAREWMIEEGCDCGVDEPESCALCLTVAALAAVEGGR